jgi:tetratricopeptide (TPR) repeat protein
MRYLIAFISLLAHFLHAQEDAVLDFEKGNNFYKNGNYSEAINQYQKIEQKGYQASELYFNLANAFYKNNQLAAAIFNYEKSLVLDANNTEALSNLTLAYKKTKDQIASPDEFNSVFKKHLFSIKILMLFIATAFFIVAIMYYKNRRAVLKNMGLVLLISLFVTFLIITLSDVNQSKKRAIIFAEKINLTNEKNKLIATLHEGTKVFILNEKKNTFEVELQDGNFGFIEKQAVKVIE